MSKWIDADALIDELQKDEAKFDKEAEDAQNDPSYTECYSDAMWSRANGIRDAIIEVYDAPTIDAVEVMHGEWMAKNSHTMYCSVCGFEEAAWRTQDYGYCPNCGAKMDKENDELDMLLL